MVGTSDNPRSDPARSFALLLHGSVCRTLRESTTPRSCHLVGGALRDAVLGVPIGDFDVVVSGQGRELAKGLARKMGSRNVELGGDRFAAFRVPLGRTHIDIWDRGDSSLESDLERRDFTIHSFALDLHTGAISDPFAGLQDLAQRRLRMTTARSFADDPLRVLRICRFRAQLAGFDIEPATLIRAGNSIPDLVSVARERIRTEIELTLAQPRAGLAARLWIRLGAVPDLVLDQPVSEDVRQQLLESLVPVWQRFEDTAAGLPATGDLVSARLALLLEIQERVGGPSSTTTADALRQRGFVTKTTATRTSRLLGAGSLPTEMPAQRWFLHTTADQWPSAVSLGYALADPSTTPETAAATADAIVGLATNEAAKIFDPPRLVSATDLQRSLGIEPGPRLGNLLAVLYRRQIEGSLGTRQEALAIAKNTLAEADMADRATGG